MKNKTVITGRRLIGVPDGRPVVLRDGSAVLIRQVRSADAPLLADGFARLSAASRQMRFLGVKKKPVGGGAALLYRSRPPRP